MALAVPLSRFTPRVGGGSAFYVRPRDTFGIELAGLAGDDLSSLILMSQISAVSLGLARAGFEPRASAAHRVLRASFFMEFLTAATASWPNKSPEPTAVGACRSAIAVHVASRRWLSFLR